MLKYLTVQKFHTLYCENVRRINIKTIYEWIDSEKLRAQKDHGGRNWLIIVDDEDPVLGKIANLIP